MSLRWIVHKIDLDFKAVDYSYCLMIVYLYVVGVKVHYIKNDDLIQIIRISIIDNI